MTNGAFPKSPFFESQRISEKLLEYTQNTWYYFRNLSHTRNNICYLWTREWLSGLLSSFRITVLQEIQQGVERFKNPSGTGMCNFVANWFFILLPYIFIFSLAKFVQSNKPIGNLNVLCKKELNRSILRHFFKINTFLWWHFYKISDYKCDVLANVIFIFINKNINESLKFCLFFIVQ